MALKIGIVGYGNRIKSLVANMRDFGVPFNITQIVDPRMEEIQASNDELITNCRFFTSLSDFMENSDIDGVMIGTHCRFHTDIACEVSRLNIPIFLEKPVAINMEQLRRLAKIFAAFEKQVVVSFPLRLTPLMSEVKRLVADGIIGPIKNIAAYNDPPYGRIYYNSWYRNYDDTGGLFLQKATHDFDCLHFLMNIRPTQICAMNSRQIYGGDMPHELRCRNCSKQKICPESTFNLFYNNIQFQNTDAHEDDWCVFSKDIKNEDSGSAIVEYENGVQATYTQNFFARNNAGRRGARLYGYDGTLEYSWVHESVMVYDHHRSKTTEIKLSLLPGSHSGGDRELCYDFLMAMMENRPTRSPLSAGIMSAITCLKARESAEKRMFCEIDMDGLLGA